MQEPNQAADRCISTPALDDLALIAAIDGEADDEVMRHLGACAHCAARAQHFADLQGLLRKQFFRMFCPPADTLVAFHEGSLSTLQYAQVKSHLAECPHCSREQRFLVQLTTDSVSGTSPPMQWYTLSADTLRQPRPPSDAPSPALRQIPAVRLPPATQPTRSFYGSARSQPQLGIYAYQADDMQISIGVRLVANRNDRRVLSGSVRLADERASALDHAIASLFHQQQVIGSAELDELGNFVLDNLQPGTYRLSFRLTDCEVIIETLSL